MGQSENTGKVRNVNFTTSYFNLGDEIKSHLMLMTVEKSLKHFDAFRHFLRILQQIVFLYTLEISFENLPAV